MKNKGTIKLHDKIYLAYVDINESESMIALGQTEQEAEYKVNEDLQHAQ